ncbi:RNA recognition motif. (a.k.a. RRM, RBD, or RNP domain) [Nesidiocoris tenuis]|uniref:RNA recognition motif. (A.k.a. RRM, RBD, or RNP domain) n=1 Tax=Nesidiocoris tenuis TaxID=355587 RepID=A0ABN7B070_9HEMI|nr:RNA recognition motif. (a.k.a. RRM, RBD, or RNP domain) [Nesidiocoris tenuis]
METGFKQEEVTYESTFDSNDFDTSLFGGNYSANFELPWPLSDEEHLNGTSLDTFGEETPVHQDDFNKTFDSWQHHISHLKVEKDFILPDDGVADQFSVSQLDELLAPALDNDPLNPDIFDDLITHESAPAFSPSSWANIKIKDESKRELEIPAPSVPDTIPSKTAENVVEKTAVDNLPPPQFPHGVKIKIEKVENDAEDDVIDVETISDVTEAFDLKNSICKLKTKKSKHKDGKSKKKSSRSNRTPSQGDDGLKVAPIIIRKTASQLRVEVANGDQGDKLSHGDKLPRRDNLPRGDKLPCGDQLRNEEQSPCVDQLPRGHQIPQSDHPPQASPKNTPSNKTIMNAFPKEIIDRIKKSAKKKKLVVVPAEPLPSKGCDHMKDAGITKAVKSRDLIDQAKIKLTSAQPSSCTTSKACQGNLPAPDSGAKLPPPPAPSPKPVIVVDAFSVTEEDKWVLDNEQKLLNCAPTASPSPSEASTVSRNNWEKNSKRDSGLESGDVSDASESPSDKKCPPNAQVMPARNVKVEKEDCSLTKQNETLFHAGNPQAPSDTHAEVPNVICIDDEPGLSKKSQSEASKKKLNLSEYRNRMKVAQFPGPIKTGTLVEELLSKQIASCSPKTDAVEEKRGDENITKPSALETRATTPPKSYDIERRKRKSRSRDKTKSRHGYRSSSSLSSGSSPESRRRSSRRRGRSRDRRRKEAKKSKKNRSPSSSRSRTHSFSRSSSSESRSRSKSRPRYFRRGSRYRGRSRSRSRSPYSREPSSYRYPYWTPNDRPGRQYDEYNHAERQKQVEERRVVYVGRIDEGTTKIQLRERFQRFGHIVDISLHFRERGDNYGFVTFASKADAYKAVEHGNDNPKEMRYEICFGGRRAFCKQRYADLDSMAPLSTYSPFHQSRPNEDFDSLFRAVQQKILRSKNV